MILGDLFQVEYGQHEYNSKSNLKIGKTPLISSQGTDNGCYGFFNISPKYKLPIITLPRTGSIGEAFVQTQPCCVDDNCLVLIPRKKIEIETLFYICLLLRKQKWRFMYGRQITPYRINTLEIGKIDIESDYEDIKNNLMPKKKSEILISEPKTSKFKVSQFFKVEKGIGGYYENLSKGKTPLVSTKEDNNSVIGYVNIKPSFKAPAITIGRISGNAKVQPYDFATVPDDMYILLPLEKYSLEILIYFANLIKKQGWRFNYSRKATPERISELIIEMPIKSKDKIDTEYIHQVISNSYSSDKLNLP